MMSRIERARLIGAKRNAESALERAIETLEGVEIHSGRGSREFLLAAAIEAEARAEHLSLCARILRDDAELALTRGRE